MAKFVQLKSRLWKSDKGINSAGPSGGVDTVSCRSHIPLVVNDVTEPEIDFSSKGDLEAYVRGLKIPASSIESWISAGLLFPDETRVAEKMLRILRAGSRKYHVQGR